MSVEAMSAVWRHSQSEGRARLVLLAIADHLGEIGAWPSISTLAKMVNASPRSVQRDIKTLEELGEIYVEEQGAPTRSQYKSNLYWIILPGVTNPISGVTEPESMVTAPESESVVTEPESGVTDSQFRGDKNDVRGDRIAVRGDSVVIQTITKPLLKKPLSKTSLDECFEIFWKIYPRREKRARASAAFIRATKIAPVDVILSGAIAYRDDPNRTPRYTRNAVNWLNDHCWLDDPQPKLQTTTEPDPWAYMEPVK